MPHFFVLLILLFHSISILRIVDTKIHMMASNERQAVDIILSGGNRHDAPQGRILMEVVGKLSLWRVLSC